MWPPPEMTRRSVLLVLSVLPAFASGSPTDLGIVERWLSTNADTRSLRIDFVQSRSLRAIKNPLAQPGTLWLDYESQNFRWQIGDPARTIVVSRGDQIAIMRTLLKKVEYRDTGSGSSTNAGGLSSLANGFPRNLEEFQRRYQILDIAAKGNSFEIITRPLGPEGEGVHQFGFVIDRDRFLLKGLVIDLTDGSTITTTFKRIAHNAPIDDDLFTPDLSDYRETRFRE